MQNDVTERDAVLVGLEHDIAIPLVIDLDGTLLDTDTLHESFLLFLRRRPAAAWRIAGWAFAGRAIVKDRLADAIGSGGTGLQCNL